MRCGASGHWAGDPGCTFPTPQGGKHLAIVVALRGTSPTSVAMMVTDADLKAKAKAFGKAPQAVVWLEAKAGAPTPKAQGKGKDKSAPAPKYQTKIKCKDHEACLNLIIATG